MIDTRNYCGRISPVRLAFIGSLLLSMVAYWSNPILSKDSAFYLDLANTFNAEGFAATLKRYDWPWYPILIAVSHQATSLSSELCAHLWCALFMAGACTVTVACVQRRIESAGYLACLVVLAMPAFNAFRGEILREFGFWFFCLLAIWLAMRWEERPGWLAGVWVQMAVAGSFLFRREALLLVPAMILWQFTDPRWRRDWLRQLQLSALPVVGVVLLGFYLAASGAFAKVGMYWSLVSPENLFVKFAEISGRFAATVLEKYSRDEAGYILFFGFLAVILLKFLKLLGPFLVPMLSKRCWSGAKSLCNTFRLSSLAWGFYLAVLMVFFIQLRFMNSRYTSFLNWLAVPLVVYLLLAFVREYPRLARVVMAVALVVMVDNVVSLSAKKTHYRDAGIWISRNLPTDATVFYDDERIRYYAGRGYSMDQTVTKAMAMSPENAGRYRYFAVEEKADAPWLQGWLTQQNRRVLARFSNAKGAAVLVIGE
ncbi:MAG: glycosyltransferase family 39 protein [Desulfuromonadales bacterium]|nr:glycosyltransferase family 39 protein [Desulfuromonadales bacterium]